MTPDISEFSYGFALTHEMIGRLGPISTAPVFPSLIQEGRAGGGYDLRLDAPGRLLFLQFKRADCMVRSTAQELKKGLTLSLPFYRLKITERSRSDQHELLLRLDTGVDDVFYVAPRFHTPRELNDAWINNAVEQKSFFIRPRDIGQLDYRSHHVAFDSSNHYVCSEPRRVKATRGEEFEAILRERLSIDERPLSSGPIAETLDRLERAQTSARADGLDLPIPADYFPDWLEPTLESTRAPIVSRGRRLPREPRTKEERQIQEIADVALRAFGLQLIVAQER